MRTQKLISFILFCVLPMLSVTAQKKLDEAYLKCQYDYQYEDDTLTHHLKKDRLVLLIGKKLSKCYSYYSMQVDTIFASPNSYEIMHQQINAAFASHTDPPHKKMKAYVYKNYPEGKMTVTDGGVMLSYYIYEDELNGQEWNMEDSTKMVLGHECQKATCGYHGRLWTAWFATDVPVSDGPWKLCGLPGLIMEAYDSKHQHVFKMVGVENVSQEPIVFSKNYMGNHRFEKTTYERFLKEQYRSLFGDFYTQVQQETGIDLSEGVSSSSDSASHAKAREGKQYKPLEILKE